MPIDIRNYPKIVTLIILIGNFLTIAMEKPTHYPQIQLQDQTKDITTVTYYGMIDDGKYDPIINSSIMYATQSIHTRLNLPSTIKDPIISFKIVDDSAQVKFKKAVPLKHCFNLNDESMLMTLKKTGSQLYPNKPELKNKLFLVKVICAKNPKLYGSSFALQRYNAKVTFYKEERHWVDTQTGDTIQQFLDAGVLERKGSTTAIMQGNNAATTEFKKWKTYKHGPNGCTSDEKLRQSLIEEKIPENKSLFKSIFRRQLTGSFR